jgi:hypothetical protein
MMPSSAWLFDPDHAASAITVALAREQVGSHFRGPPVRFGEGKGLKGRIPLHQRQVKEGLTSPKQPHWIMDQIYLLLTSFHVVIQPFALCRVARQTRTITSRFRFVNLHTPDTLALFQAFAPKFFADVSPVPRCFSAAVLRKVNEQLVAAASNDKPGVPIIPRRFCWDMFFLSPIEREFVILDSLRGLFAALHVRFNI